ncbi:cystatin-B-like [Pseudophryne corroboree]|uniref:cystatin-B-like n=1 Tax=Pseudophryne corroboree TaxID=495146 RepID=UPI003081D366
MRRCGGTGPVKPADAEVQAICEQMRAPVELKVGKAFSIFQAIQYKTQCVAGTNYFVKVQVGHDEYIHMRIYQPLPCMNADLSLTAFQVGKSREEEINHFEPSD